MCCRSCFLGLRVGGSRLGFTRVCAVADMMYNRCEAARRGDVPSCPCRHQPCPPPPAPDVPESPLKPPLRVNVY